MLGITESLVSIRTGLVAQRHFVHGYDGIPHLQSTIFLTWKRMDCAELGATGYSARHLPTASGPRGAPALRIMLGTSTFWHWPL